MKQVSIIESLRALAAISVCLFHFVCTTVGLFLPQSIINVLNLGQYGVHIFFVISGFIIPYSMYHNNFKVQSVFKFIAKRFIRIEPPYLISIALILGIIFIKHRFHVGVDEMESISLNRVLLHLGYLINFFGNYKWLNNVYWTLAIEFQYYLCMALMFLLFVNKNIVFRICAYAICFLAAYFIPDPVLNHYPAYAPLFLMGTAVFLFLDKLILNYEFWIVFVLCIAYNYFKIEFAFAFVGSLTALCILYFTEIKIPILHQLGKISYSLYLIHPVIGAAVINIGSRFVNGNIQKMGLIFVAIIVTVISSYIMYWLIEKPSKKLSSQIKL